MEQDKTDELVILIGIGIIGYGLMAAMGIYLICNILKWHNLLYMLIGITAFCVSMVIYSIVKLIKLWSRKM